VGCSGLKFLVTSACIARHRRHQLLLLFQRKTTGMSAGLSSPRLHTHTICLSACVTGCVSLLSRTAFWVD
jgi:hypothetical protein